MDNDFLNKLVEHRILEAVSGGPLEGMKKTGGLVSASCLFGFRVRLWVGFFLICTHLTEGNFCYLPSKNKFLSVAKL